MSEKSRIVTGENVRKETYYNVLQLCRITGYADPIAALTATGEMVDVTRDACGNILSGRLLAEIHPAIGGGL